MDIRFDRAEQIRHAYILSAPTLEESCEKALQIAQAAVCRSGGAVPCGNCIACKKAAGGVHPDITLIERLLDDKGKKKRELQVDQVRAVASDAAILPNEAERKVYIFRDGDYMNTEAQNAALKLLEEPPKGVILILCTTNPATLLSTVRSRCVLMTFAGNSDSANSELEQLAEEYLQLVAGGDRLAIWRFCEDNNGLSFQEMADFCTFTVGKITDLLCGRRAQPKIASRRLLELEQLMERCITLLKVNVNVKQVFGLLEINSLPQAREEN